MRLRSATRLASVVVLSAASARAEEPPRPSGGPQAVAVLPSPCSDLPWTPGVLEDLLRVELAADGVRVVASESTDGRGGRSPYVTVEPDRCGVAKSATLAFTSDEVRRSRVIDLVDVDPAARPRVLAIAMAELVRQGLTLAKATTSKALLSPPPNGQELRVRIELERLPATAALRDNRADRSALVVGGAETTVFAQRTTGLLGFRVGVLLPVNRWLAIDTDAGALWGSAHDPLGDVDETIATVGVGLLGTGGPEGLLLGLGPRVQAGAGRFRGIAAAPTTVASSTTAPVLLLTLSGFAAFRVEGSLWAFFALDVGTSAYGFDALAESGADRRHVADVLGPILSARLGIGWRP